jgi:hypothetical protein
MAVVCGNMKITDIHFIGFQKIIHEEWEKTISEKLVLHLWNT